MVTQVEWEVNYKQDIEGNCSIIFQWWIYGSAFVKTHRTIHQKLNLMYTMFEKEKGLSVRMLGDAHNGMQTVTNEIDCINNI